MSDTNGVSAEAESTTRDQAEVLREVGRELRQRAEEVRKEVINQLHSAADKLRDEARNIEAPDIRQSTDRIAAGLEKAANYLSSRPIDQYGQEAVRVVKQRPWRALGVIFVVGLVIGILLRSGDD